MAAAALSSMAQLMATSESRQRRMSSDSCSDDMTPHWGMPLGVVTGRIPV